MHSASFITCFSVGALHSSEIHRVRSSALSLLARVGPRGDLPVYVAARVYASRLRRRRSFRKSKIIAATVSVAIERGIYKISGRGKAYGLDRQRIVPGRTLRPYFRRCRAPLPYLSAVLFPCVFACCYLAQSAPRIFVNSQREFSYSRIMPK